MTTKIRKVKNSALSSVKKENAYSGSDQSSTKGLRKVYDLDTMLAQLIFLDTALEAERKEKIKVDSSSGLRSKTTKHRKGESSKGKKIFGNTETELQDVEEKSRAVVPDDDSYRVHHHLSANCYRNHNVDGASPSGNSDTNSCASGKDEKRQFSGRVLRTHKKATIRRDSTKSEARSRSASRPKFAEKETAKSGIELNSSSPGSKPIQSRSRGKRKMRTTEKGRGKNGRKRKDRDSECEIEILRSNVSLISVSGECDDASERGHASLSNIESYLAIDASTLNNGNKLEEQLAPVNSSTRKSSRSSRRSVGDDVAANLSPANYDETKPDHKIASDLKSQKLIKKSGKLITKTGDFSPDSFGTNSAQASEAVAKRESKVETSAAKKRSKKSEKKKSKQPEMEPGETPNRVIYISAPGVLSTKKRKSKSRGKSEKEAESGAMKSALKNQLKFSSSNKGKVEREKKEKLDKNKRDHKLNDGKSHESHLALEAISKISTRQKSTLDQKRTKAMDCEIKNDCEKLLNHSGDSKNLLHRIDKDNDSQRQHRQEARQKHKSNARRVLKQITGEDRERIFLPTLIRSDHSRDQRVSRARNDNSTVAGEERNKKSSSDERLKSSFQKGTHREKSTADSYIKDNRVRETIRWRVRDPDTIRPEVGVRTCDAVGHRRTRYKSSTRRVSNKSSSSNCDSASFSSTSSSVSDSSVSSYSSSCPSFSDDAPPGHPRCLNKRATNKTRSESPCTEEDVRESPLNGIGAPNAIRPRQQRSASITSSFLQNRSLAVEGGEKAKQQHDSIGFARSRRVVKKPGASGKKADGTDSDSPPPSPDPSTFEPIFGRPRANRQNYCVVAEGEGYFLPWQYNQLLQVSDKQSASCNRSAGFSQPIQPKQTFLEKRPQTLRDLYSLHNVLSSTPNGTVIAGYRRSDGMRVAIKRISKDSTNRWGKMNSKTVPLELALLTQVNAARCTGVVQVVEWHETSEAYLLIMVRPHPAVDLYDYVCKHKRIKESLARLIIRQLVTALDDCLNSGVLHRDVKLENILLNPETLTTTLIDFGCGDYVRAGLYKEFSGTPEYYPPEWFSRRQYNADPLTAWSIGVLLYSLLSGTLPFRSSQDIREKEANKYPFDVSRKARDLVSALLQKNPRDRLRMNEILKHPWMTKSGRKIS